MRAALLLYCFTSTKVQILTQKVDSSWTPPVRVKASILCAGGKDFKDPAVGKVLSLLALLAQKYLLYSYRSPRQTLRIQLPEKFALYLLYFIY